MLGVESRKAGVSRPNARGPDPVYFGAGCLERPRFYKINFLLVTFNVLVVFSTGMIWWRLIGLCCPANLLSSGRSDSSARTAIIHSCSYETCNENFFRTSWPRGSCTRSGRGAGPSAPCSRANLSCASRRASPASR
nr:anion permease [uncultured Sutterella sp.]